VPRFEPERWNDSGEVQSTNNCYNYACDVRNGTYAQPGRASGIGWVSVDCHSLRGAAIADGLQKIDCDDPCPYSDCHRVALVIADLPGFEDFHWYRQDSDGFWSHKPGASPATNRDSSGELIRDPRTADTRPYTVFCGCFCHCEGRVRIG
jgi:hypothetical protein